MKQCKSLIFLMVFSFSCQLLHAQDFVDGVPRELVEQFTNGQISAGFPDNFPAMELPGTINVFGSLDNDFSQVVVLETALPQDEAMMAVAGSLEDSGWEMLASITYEQPAIPIIL